MTAKLITTLAAILAVTFLEYHAINQGIDGALLGVTIAILSGLGGYESKQLISLIKTVKRPK